MISLIIHLLPQHLMLSGTHTLSQDSVSIGSSNSVDYRIEGPNVAAEHAQLTQKSGRTFCTALLGDEEDLNSTTYTWLNGGQIRKGGQLLQSSSLDKQQLAIIHQIVGHISHPAAKAKAIMMTSNVKRACLHRSAPIGITEPHWAEQWCRSILPLQRLFASLMREHFAQEWRI